MRGGAAILLLSLAPALVANGQGPLARLDSLLARRYYGPSVDTAYIQRPTSRWTLKARLHLSASELSAQGTFRDAPFASGLTSGVIPKVSLSASYLGLSASLSANPKRLFGEGDDYELYLNYCGRRVGAEAAVNVFHSPTGWVQHGDDEATTIELNAIRQVYSELNVHYIFSPRRFSYPAAFSQSYIQRRGGGSLMAGATAAAMQIDLGDSTQGDSHYEYSNLQLGLGMGYGYNFVPARHWLLHVSALPMVVLTSRRKFTLDGEDQPMERRQAEFAIVGRGSVVYSFKKAFLGVQHNFYFSNTDIGEVGLRNVRSRFTLFVGVRL